MLRCAGMSALHDMTATVAMQWMPSAAIEALSLFGALFLVTAVIVLGIMFLRKRRGARRSRRHHPPELRRTVSLEPATRRSFARHQQKRRRRRERRSRNPTLAETGGLPPLRQDNPPPTPS